jgi:hypothetical protein
MNSSKPKFIIIKRKETKNIVYFENDNMLGYDIKPKKNIKLKGAIAVNKMLIIEPELIDKLVNKKINRRFKDLITNLSSLYDDDDDDGTNLMQALNQIEKFRREIYNKYRNYMNKEIQLMLEKKLSILENEVKLRLYNFTYNYNNTNEKEGKRSR